jgi:hypothetical protein
MSFFAARLQAMGGTPRTRELVVAAGQAFYRGALLVKDSNGAWAECGADPAAVAAVANSDFQADTTGFSHLGRSEFPPGYMQATKVSDEQPFLAKYVGSLPAADGASYGVVRDTDGLWKVDFAEVTTLVVKLVGRRTNSPENVALVEVVFLPAVVQIV